VPAIVRSATEQQKLELALIENIQQPDLSKDLETPNQLFNSLNKIETGTEEDTESPDNITNVVIKVPEEVFNRLVKQAKDLKGTKVGKRNAAEYKQKIDDLKNKVIQWIETAQGEAPCVAFGNMNVQECESATDLKDILDRGINLLGGMRLHQI
jgi:ParB-like chromosome segregation protein Spo0J